MRLSLAAFAIALVLLPVATADPSVELVDRQEHGTPCSMEQTRLIVTHDEIELWAGGFTFDCGPAYATTFIGAGVCIPDTPVSSPCQSVGWMDTTTPEGRFCSVSNLMLVPCPPFATPELAWGDLLP